MSIGPLAGVAGSLAGSPLAQTKGSESERARQDAAVGQRRIDTDQKAEAAAGIGETDGEDHETSERDADGRRPLERQTEAERAEQGDSSQRSPPKDTSGQSGSLLDLTG